MKIHFRTFSKVGGTIEDWGPAGEMVIVTTTAVVKQFTNNSFSINSPSWMFLTQRYTVDYRRPEYFP